jgi:organic hydroperoxide reductase OsmC/OhrA
MTLDSKTFSYHADLVWQGGRMARATAGERPPVLVGPPRDFPGGDPNQWSPEHLFLASLQSCTMLSFLAHCSHNDVEVTGYESEADGEIARREDDQRYAFRTLTMAVTAVVAAGQADLARGLTAKAERDCFISASTRAEVETRWQISE